MKKINNKYRNNNNSNNNYNNNYNNQIYSLNYKFDSSSPAGKFNGTALDLIKKYNELAKDALSNSDYTAAEVYRQYAEHYRKIVTEINEKKMQRNAFQRDNERTENNVESGANEAIVENNNAVEVAENSNNFVEAPITPIINTPSEKKEFKIIEIKDEHKPNSDNVHSADDAQPKKRVYRRKSPIGEATA